ncbi:MAG: octanoyltransferase [Gammaproteobacteria bacterium RIFCSPHIGHO2_12_FULL_37_14]|nr:MAG: octanoyltransferase [Gammaproteobacteria bacterium RIFCSPHIGHO2_12_FULL_37_14]
MIFHTINIRWLGRQHYLNCWQAMQEFTDKRTDNTADEIWLLEHHPVFTQGQSGKPEHLLHPNDIPVIQTDRGGQITYHGPGQLMVYTLIDIKRKKFNIRQFVTLLEQSVIELLSSYHIPAYTNCNAPGVYVKTREKLDPSTSMKEHKICSIGLRIRRGCSYHGIALNVAMDLEPFTKINPCGFPGLLMTQCSVLDGPNNVYQTAKELANYLFKKLGYNSASFV